MRWYFLVILLFFLLPSVAQKAHYIKEVIVEGKAELNAFEKMKNSGDSRIVITNKELNSYGHRTAGDVIKRLPRILVQGPPSFNRNIMMGGLDKEYQCVLINGKRPAGGEDSRDIKLDRIPVSMIERIEIIYNPPASLGADATIGAVNIVLKELPKDTSVRTNIAFDKSSTSNRINPRLDLGLGGSIEKWSGNVNLSLNSLERNNVNHVHDQNIKGQEQENVHLNITGFSTTFSHTPDSMNKWELNSFFSDYNESLSFLSDVKRKSKGGLNLQADTALDIKKRLMHSHTLSHSKINKRSRWQNQLTFAQHIDRKDRNRKSEKSSHYETSLEDEDQNNKEIVLESDYSLSGLIGGYKNRFNAGFRSSVLFRDYQRYVYTKDSEHRFWDSVEDGSYDLNEYRMGLYFQDEVSIGKLWLSPALRVDLDFNNYKTSAESGQSKYFSPNPSLHAKYNFTSGYFIKADVARQISRPPFNLLVPVDKVKHKKQMIEQGNPDLIPSKAINFSVGTEKYFNNNSYISLRGFYSRLKDVIETREVGIDENYGYRIYQSVNVDSAKVWGLDLNTRIKILNRSNHDLSLNGNISRLGSEVRDPETMQLRTLNEQPKWITNSSLDYLNTSLRIQGSIGVNYLSERFISATTDKGVLISELVQLPFMQWDAQVKYFVNSHTSIYVNALNLFNETLDFKQGTVRESEIIGRNFIIGLSWIY